MEVAFPCSYFSHYTLNIFSNPKTNEFSFKIHHRAIQQALKSIRLIYHYQSISKTLLKPFKQLLFKKIHRSNIDRKERNEKKNSRIPN